MQGVLPYYEDPRYWSGEINARPGDNIVAGDFPMNAVKAACLDLVLSRIPKQAPCRVLDLGCAFGYLVRWLRRFGHETWGVDISRYTTERAPASVKPYIVRGSILELPFPNKTFDLVVSTGVLEHIHDEDLPRAIGEITRVGIHGYLAITLAGDPGAEHDPNHTTLKSRDEWQALLPVGFIARSDANEFWTGAYDTLP